MPQERFLVLAIQISGSSFVFSPLFLLFLFSFFPSLSSKALPENVPVAVSVGITDECVSAVVVWHAGDPVLAGCLSESPYRAGEGTDK